MKIGLICPDANVVKDMIFSESPILDAFLRPFVDKMTRDFIQGVRRRFLIPPHGLLLVAGLTPSDVEVTLIDERVEPIDFDCDVDLVALSVLTKTAHRAYEIADEFRQRGVKVIMGGYHPTALPHEAAKHADAVVIGEAEGTWPQLVEDFKKGCLRRYYRSDNLSDLSTVKNARRDLLKKEFYLTPNVIQATRGCPHACEFCSVHLVSGGRRQRLRPVEDVVEEISTFTDNLVIFTDDNLVGNKRYAKELFRALIPLRIKWFGEMTLLLAMDEELLDLAASSGCILQCAGIDSLSQTNMDEVHKQFNRCDCYEELIERIHQHGIAVLGSLILGFDGDDVTSFDAVVDFVNENQIEWPNINVLTPYPGTAAFEKMKKENRILTEDWSLYNTAAANVVFQPKQMSPLELQEGYHNAYKRIFSFPSIMRRVLGTRHLLIPSLNYNLQMRRAAIRERKELFL